MKYPSWRPNRVLLACTVLAIIPMLLLSSTTSAKITGPTIKPATLAKSVAPKETECEKLRKWAKPYTGKAMTLEEMANFDRRHRIAVFNVMSYEVRSKLWREHLQRFSQRSDLSEAQRALIAEGMELLTPSFYEVAAKNKGPNQAAKDFWTRAKPLFTTPEQRRPWFDLGSVVEGSVASAPMPVKNTTTAVKGKAGASTDYCFCNVQQNDCFGGGWNCFPPFGACQSTQTGCGPFGGSACNGYCQFS